MASQASQSLPFFSYGVFKPGEIGFLRISECVDDFQEGVVEGYLFERNGMAMFSQALDPSPVGGFLLRLSSPEEVYNEINRVEPEGQYEWCEIKVKTSDETISANILVASEKFDPKYGSVGRITPMEHELHNQVKFDWYGNVIWWDGKNDILFDGAMEKIGNVIDSSPERIIPEDPDHISGDAANHFFEVQMAYLLLWTVIERFLNIRYATDGEARVGDWKAMAEDKPFRRKLEDVVSDTRNGDTLLDLRTAERLIELERDNSEQAIRYYRRLRNNIAHRGKGAGQTEYEALYKSCWELFQCFSHELDETFDRSQDHIRSQEDTSTEERR